MRPLNNDMDSLMRKAAEAYHVPPSGADWEKVAMALYAEGAVEINNKDWRHSRRYGLLLFFLLTSLVCNKYLFQPYGSKLAKSATATNEVVISNAPEPNIQATERETEMGVVIRNNTENINLKNVSFSFYQSGVTKEPTPKTNRGQNAIPADAYVNMEIKTVDRFSISQRQTKIDLNKISSKTFLIPFVNKAPTIEEPEKAEKTEWKTERKNRRFYGGAVAGPDISTVKNEKSSGPGFSAGIVGGYQLNKRWAVETGLLWDRKNYYSKGRHFNTGKMNLPSHTNIIYAEGYCHMFEIPLNLRYHFGESKKHRWFASAGASSYLMQKEEYHYLYERYNVQYYDSKSYKAASRNWFSVANLSAGYEYDFKKGLSIRMEPYLKLPLSGLGIGSLPITSTGVQLGVTYPIQ